MEMIENSIGWEDEYGNQIAYKKEFAFLNIGRNPKYETPIMREVEEVLKDG